MVVDAMRCATVFAVPNTLRDEKHLESAGKGACSTTRFFGCGL